MFPIVFLKLNQMKTILEKYNIALVFTNAETLLIEHSFKTEILTVDMVYDNFRPFRDGQLQRSNIEIKDVDKKYKKYYQPILTHTQNYVNLISQYRINLYWKDNKIEQNG